MRNWSATSARREPLGSPPYKEPVNFRYNISVTTNNDDDVDGGRGIW
jgi:hypothetical protein